MHATRRASSAKGAAATPTASPASSPATTSTRRSIAGDATSPAPTAAVTAAPPSSGRASKRARTTMTTTDIKAELDGGWDGAELSSPMGGAGVIGMGGGTLKYRKYRERQRNKVINMETELDDLRSECEELHRRESKLLYLLLMSGKRDGEVARVTKERDELQLRLAMEMRYSRALARILTSKGERVPETIQGAGVDEVDDSSQLTTAAVGGSQPTTSSQKMPMAPPPPGRGSTQLAGPSSSIQFVPTSSNNNISARPSLFANTNGTLSFSALLQEQGNSEFLFLDKVLAESNFPMARDHFVESMIADEKAMKSAAASKLPLFRGPGSNLFESSQTIGTGAADFMQRARARSRNASVLGRDDLDHSGSIDDHLLMFNDEHLMPLINAVERATQIATTCASSNGDSGHTGTEAETIAAMALTTVGSTSALSPSKVLVPTNGNGAARPRSSSPSEVAETSNDQLNIASKSTTVIPNNINSATSITTPASASATAAVSASVIAPSVVDMADAHDDTTNAQKRVATSSFSAHQHSIPPLEAENGFAARFKANKTAATALTSLMCAETLQS